MFVAASMLEERQTFARNWFAPVAPATYGTAEDRRAAAEAVHQFRTLAAHWYGTGGDRRFGERLPASEELVDELRRDIEYVGRNGRIETPRLMRIEFVASDLTSDASAIVTTREFWITEFHWPGGGASDAARSDVVFGRYRLTRDGSRWLVAAWDPQEARAE